MTIMIEQTMARTGREMNFSEIHMPLIGRLHQRNRIEQFGDFR
jgi:hypothetical protein